MQAWARCPILTNQDLHRIVHALSILVFEQSDWDLDQSRWGISIHLAHAWCYGSTLLRVYLRWKPRPFHRRRWLPSSFWRRSSGGRTFVKHEFRMNLNRE